jgi:hypothetical protein
VGERTGRGSDGEFFQRRIGIVNFNGFFQVDFSDESATIFFELCFRVELQLKGG